MSTLIRSILLPAAACVAVGVILLDIENLLSSPEMQLTGAASAVLECLWCAAGVVDGAVEVSAAGGGAVIERAFMAAFIAYPPGAKALNPPPAP